MAGNAADASYSNNQSAVNSDKAVQTLNGVSFRKNAEYPLTGDDMDVSASIILSTVETQRIASNAIHILGKLGFLITITNKTDDYRLLTSLTSQLYSWVDYNRYNLTIVPTSFLCDNYSLLVDRYSFESRWMYSNFRLDSLGSSSFSSSPVAPYSTVRLYVEYDMITDFAPPEVDEATVYYEFGQIFDHYLQLNLSSYESVVYSGYAEDTAGARYDDFTSSGDAADGSNPAVDSASSAINGLEQEGLGSQITAVASDIMGVFSSEGVPAATLTLPALRLTVQGVEYEVWPDYTFDFAMLDTWGFSALMSAVRFATVAAVYLALFKYMIALIDSIVEDRALEMVISEAD